MSSVRAKILGIIEEWKAEGTKEALFFVSRDITKVLDGFCSELELEIKGAEQMIQRLPLKIQKEYHTGRKHGYLDVLDNLKGKEASK